MRLGSARGIRVSRFSNAELQLDGARAPLEREETSGCYWLVRALTCSSPTHGAAAAPAARLVVCSDLFVANVLRVLLRLLRLASALSCKPSSRDDSSAQPPDRRVLPCLLLEQSQVAGRTTHAALCAEEALQKLCAWFAAMDITLRRKRATALPFGKRKRRAPIPRHSRNSPTSRQSVGNNEVTLDPQPSTSYRNPADNAEVVRRRCVSESSTEGMLIDVITHQREAARSPNRDRAVEHDGETIDAEMTGASADAVNQRSDNETLLGERRTIQGHIQRSFLSAQTAEAQSTTVRESLGAMSATERKFALTASQERETMPAPEEEYVLMQMTALNAMIGKTLCPICHEQDLAVDRDTRLGLAVKMVLICRSCGTASSHWSSERKEDARVFDENVRSVQAIRCIGKGPTAINDFWAVMNVSHRGLHQKTYQRHLKNVIKPAAKVAAQTVLTDAVQAVKNTYEEMEVNFTKNITVVYDGTWLTRGHSSHIGVGCVIEFYTGLVIDCTVLSNFCLGCTLGPPESHPTYEE